MKIFIAATPIFNAAMEVEAYRMCDKSGERALPQQNDFRFSKADALLTPGLDLLEQIGVEPLAADKPLFVDINRMHLLKGNPTNLKEIAPERLVCVLPGGLPDDEALLERCENLKNLGYPIAIENFPLSGVNSPYLRYANYLILKNNDVRRDEIIRAMANQHPKIRLVLSRVADTAAYEWASRDKLTRDALFSGDFYSRPITKGDVQVSPLKVNALQLLREINRDDFELSDISAIIGRDPSLSISLMRFINSSASGLSRRVDSIQSAVAIMGQQEVRRWGMVAITENLAEDRPGEVTRLSLIRAKFAENLAGIFELGVFQSQLFIAGLFSLLDVILSKPMEQAVQEVAVNEKVRQALVDKTGDLYPVLELIYEYERAEWDTVSILLIRNNVDIEAVFDAFVDALTWYNQLLTSIDEQDVVGKA
ncbi:HDOD domain-containing protein [Ruminococcaceae bacterium OttesenSCG-928-D13]|nr:HDOD domain-containing protein [Ruminococcaceae bacterium OttesenSCG-928-D13]